MITDHLLLKANDNLVGEIINFYTSEKTNPALFAEIKEFCVGFSKKAQKQNAETFINMGYLSLFDFLTYMSHVKKIGKNGIEIWIVELTLQQLVKNFIIIPLDSDLTKNHDSRYRISGTYVNTLYQAGLIKNLLYGFNHIIINYMQSVVKIVHFDENNDPSIGTGFLITEKFGDHKLIVTNRHVVEKNKELKVYTVEDKELRFIDIFEDSERDIALIEIEQVFGKPFYLNDQLEVMTEIITMGYPTIPTTKYAYQVYHKGEVNSFVENYWNNKLFLISAKTSSGNSGSPIIDKTGRVVGMITEELFEKENFYKKGKLPYYAGIPAIEIMKSINKFKAVK